jgi:hypothetical protein
VVLTYTIHTVHTPYSHRTHGTYTLRTYTVRAQEEQWDSRAEAKNDIRDRLANLSVLPGISAKGQANGQVRTVCVRSYVRMFYTSMWHILESFGHFSHSFHSLLLFSFPYFLCSLENLFIVYLFFIYPFIRFFIH